MLGDGRKFLGGDGEPGGEGVDFVAVAGVLPKDAAVGVLLESVPGMAGDGGELLHGPELWRVHRVSFQGAPFPHMRRGVSRRPGAVKGALGLRGAADP